METYVIPITQSKASIKSRFLSVISTGSTYAAGLLFVQWLCPGGHSTKGPIERIAGDVFQGILWAVTLLWFTGWQGKQTQPAEIQVDGHEIRGITYFRFKKISRSVKRGEVHLLVEKKIPSGRLLVISRYGRFGTFMWGKVCIPDTLPQYEEIKRLAESWKSE